MAYRYLIYATGTTYATTIKRESATNNPGVNEASFYTDFVIPEIQPLYLWRVTGGNTVVPNLEPIIYAYEESIAPPPEPTDLVTYGELTGETAGKINIVTGAVGYLGTFTVDGNLEDSGYQISDLTGGTTYNFVGSGGTQISQTGTNPKTITIFSAVPTGTTVSWGTIVGNIQLQTDLQNQFNTKLDNSVFTGYTASTNSKLNNKLNTSVFSGYTGTTDLRLQGIEGDIIYLSGQTANKLNTLVFTNYTGATQPVLNAALTGVTKMGTGTTLISTPATSSRNVQLKSISVRGGISLGGDANNLILSGETNVSSAWGNITGILSNQTDLWSTLTGMSATTATKLNTSVFSGYTGTTDLRLQGIEGDIIYLSGQTDLKLATSVFSGYTGATQPILNTALTGATNGLTKSGRNAELGGALSKNTVISGTTYDFSVNTKSVKLQAINGIDIIDTDGVGGINIESDGGIIALVGNDNLSIEKTKLEISATQMLITDSRAAQIGLQYAQDYSTTFTDESLITKRYADAIASGLIPKAAVLVATTTGITLTGLQTIDGIALANGDRVLVRNQSIAADNGIYVASASTWTRATDYDGTPDGEVSSGNLIPILSGTSLHNTIFVLVTPNPITLGVTALNFTLFSSPHELIAGIGISILGNTISVNGNSLAGNSITWSGNTFNVNPATGTLSSALGAKENTITGAATSITTANLSASRALVSDGSGKVAVSSITSTELGWLSGTTANIQTQINSKQATITGAATSIVSANLTASRVLVSDGSGKVAVGNATSTELNFLSGVTSNIQSQLNTKLATTVFSNYTGTTKTAIDGKLATAVFSAYTGNTKANEIFLVHTGGTDINTVAATEIPWHSAEVTGSLYSWTGGSDIKILSANTYEVSYNLPFGHSGSNNIRGIGGNIVLNNATVINNTAAAGATSRANMIGSLNLSTVILTLAANDVLTLIGFRTGLAGISNTLPNGSILIKKKNTLQ